MNTLEQVDVAVIGGGPGGCTFAILAAQAGLKVTLIERENFPRHKIGESLLPANTPLFKRLGVFEAIDKGPHQKKPGAVFTNQAINYSRKVKFREAFDCVAPYAYQVERSVFDQIFLDRASEVGVEIVQPAQVLDVLGSADQVQGLVFRDPSGDHSLPATMTIDASGRAICLAKRIAQVERDPVLNQSSAYAYYDSFALSPIAEPGDIEIMQSESAWVWLIPLNDGRISVGAVWPRETIKSNKKRLEDLFCELIASSEILQARLPGANLCSEIRTVADYSYRVDPSWGRGWLCVGDAAVFVDPVFSSGVMLSTLSAERAFDLMVRELTSGAVPSIASLKLYQEWLDRGLKRFKSYIYGYYTPGFQKVFYSDPPLHAFRRAVASNLAGNVFDPSLWTRMWTSFFWWNVRRENRRLGYHSPFPGLS